MRRRWLMRLEPRLSAELRLLCFPYAGASAMAYGSWPSLLPESIEVWAVQSPGHGWRLAEPPLRRLDPLLDGVLAELEERWDGSPFAFFGHSMGAIVAYEAARGLRRLGRPLPECLIVSGAAAPHLQPVTSDWHRLPDSELLEELRGLNGTPPEILERPVLRRLLLPTLRADLELGETYRYVEEPALPCPLLVLGGAGDQAVSAAELDQWARHTDGEFSVALHRGDHFFIHSDPGAVLSDVVERLVPAGTLPTSGGIAT